MLSKILELSTGLEMKPYEEVCYDESIVNKNNLSYWFSKIKDCGINSPKTVVVPIKFDQFKWLMGDSYKIEEINSMGDYFFEILKESQILNVDGPIFVKTGTYSNKFDFSSCKVDDTKKLGSRLLEIYYAAMCCGAGYGSEFVFREFIDSSVKKPTIYNGMPLNTEFRVFYNFDIREVLDVINYWDTDVMLGSLEKNMRSHEDVEEYKNFKEFAPLLESEFNKHKQEVFELVFNSMKNVEGLDGVWSIDIMMVDEQFYLIDMAIGSQSYYYDRVKHLINS